MNPYLRFPGPAALCPASCKTQTTQHIAVLAIPKLSAGQKKISCPSKNQNCQLYNKWAHPSRQILSPFVFNTITLIDNKNHWARSGTQLNMISSSEYEDDFWSVVLWLAVYYTQSWGRKTPKEYRKRLLKKWDCFDVVWSTQPNNLIQQILRDSV